MDRKTQKIMMMNIMYHMKDLYLQLRSRKKKERLKQ